MKVLIFFLVLFIFSCASQVQLQNDEPIEMIWNSPKRVVDGQRVLVSSVISEKCFLVEKINEDHVVMRDVAESEFFKVTKDNAVGFVLLGVEKEQIKDVTRFSAEIVYIVHFSF